MWGVYGLVKLVGVGVIDRDRVGRMSVKKAGGSTVQNLYEKV